MDLTSTWSSLADQGVMFWSATGAVALGTTLILGAGFLHLRRWRSRPISKISPVPAQTPAKGKMTAETPKTPARATIASETQNTREMHLLLARLRSAADRLEDFRRANGENPAPTGESPLKESLDGVDYLFRTGTA